ncbi:hypothetical protein [Streptomyces sp. NPDC051704]|uniref:hypothetical protein n=1 Tax=Streptomyces sp. NPDC051704 TaxID=3365671 RepID=UPI003793A065
MTRNEKDPQQVATARGPKVSATNGSTAASLSHSAPAAQQGGLFPGGDTKPVARPLVLITRGRVEYLAYCPECRVMHRHVHLGNVTGPCGTEYELRSRQGRAAA